MNQRREFNHDEIYGEGGLLPHKRFWALLNGVEVHSDRIVGLYTVTEEVCDGHFDVLPGVIREEIIGHTMGVGLLANAPLPDRLPMATRTSRKVYEFQDPEIEGKSYRAAAMVGDEVRIEVRIISQGSRGAVGTGAAFVGDRKICEIDQITGLLVPKSALQR